MNTETIQLILTALGPVSFLTSIALFRIFRKMVQTMLLEMGNTLINAKINDILAHPEAFDPIIGKFLGRFTQKGSGGSMNIMGFKVPPMLQPLVEGFMKKAADKLIGGVAGGNTAETSNTF